MLPGGSKRRKGPTAGAVAAIVLLILAGLLPLPSVHAQAVCEDDPSLPHCTEPPVDVELPDAARAPWEPLRQGQVAEVSVPVNVTYGGGEQTTVTVDPMPSPAGVQVTGAEATVGPQDTVTLPVVVQVAPGVGAGSHQLGLRVNTSGTNAHAPASQEVATELHVPWWVAGGVSSVWGTGGGLHIELRLQGFVANGPVDLLVTSPEHEPVPSLIETSRALAEGRPVTGTWIIDLAGSPEDVTVHAWPVVASEDGLACIDRPTGQLVPVEGSSPDPGCRAVLTNQFGTTGQVGGWVGTVIMIVMGLVLLGMAGAVALGVFVLRRGGPEPPARALGVYLILAGVAFVPVALRFLLQESVGIATAVRFLADWFVAPVLLVLVALAAAVLTFALSYPTVHPRFQGSRRWLAIPLVPSSAMAGYLAVELVGALRANLPRAMILGMAYVALSAVASGGLFWHRARNASTGLERGRLRFMVRAVALPLGAGAGAALGVVVLGEIGGFQAVATGALQLSLAVVALLPVVGMAWGVLRYKVVDLEEGLRFTLGRGFAGASLVVVFFVATEAAETVLSGAFGPVIGLAAAGVLALALAPLERAGRRVASRVIPEPEDPASYRTARRLEVYRATFEEATADEELTDKEVRTLASLADSLGLSDEEVASVEAEVRRERQAAPGAADG